MRIPRWAVLSWPPMVLQRITVNALAVASALALLQSQASAQESHHVKLHVNPKWKQCSFQLDRSLTQSAWQQFTKEAGVVSYFRPLADARPMGAGKFELSMVQWETKVDDTDSAWNDTFVHPDSTHWLYEGSGLQFPGLTGRVGLTDKTDLGIYFTKNVEANYGFYGAQVQRNLVRDAERNWAASARLSFMSLYGPEDLGFTVYGVDLVASRQYALFSSRALISPYAGVSATWSRSHEKSPVVNLADESILGGQGMVGAVAQVAGFKIAAEYGVASVQSFSLKVAVGSR